MLTPSADDRMLIPGFCLRLPRVSVRCYHSAMLRKPALGLSALLFAFILCGPQSPACQGEQSSAPAHHLFFRVTLSTSFYERQSGRLLIFLRKGSGEKELRPSFIP